MVRIVVCLDVNAAGPADAYLAVYNALGVMEANTLGDVQWESTDEWYDDDGERIPLSDIEEARTFALYHCDE